ncbi:MAG: NYN domain-containing protein [Candidatus Schekmanbacteria bacterium]|nr:NYN domain-containing protein [Candidatus Schekmanbacteria bacterium]
MNTALYVDYEYVRKSFTRNNGERRSQPESVVSTLVEAVRRLEHGRRRVVIREVFADWDRVEASAVLQSLFLAGFHPGYAASRRERNTPDVELSLSALECLLTRDDVTRFVIMAGDRAFIPIATRLREYGREVTILAYSDTAAAELLDAVGASCVLEADFFGRSGLERNPERRRTLPGDLAIERSGADEPGELHKECVRLVLEAESRHGAVIWLVPFYKEYMNVHFDDLNNVQRKMIVNDLVEWGVLSIEQRSSGAGAQDQFSVLMINDDHELVRQVRAALARDEHGGNGTLARASNRDDSSRGGAEPHPAPRHNFDD